MHKGLLFGITLTLLIVALVAANLLCGSVDIPAEAVWTILRGGEGERASWTFIIWESRVPQLITALLPGMALSTAGLLLQTTFNNPLADPSILGISAGASLGVAIVMLAGVGTVAAGAFTLSGFLVVIAAALVGATTVMGIILLFSTIVKSNILLLIIGIMVGYVTSSAISLLNFFATSEGVHSYIIWGMGNFCGVSLAQLPVFAISLVAALLMAVLLIKPLNQPLLCRHFAEKLGINVGRTRNLLLFVTSLLTAITTAFCGPIAFIGLAVPHVARMMLTTANHQILLPITMLTGAAVSLGCNLLSVILPGEGGLLPLNAVTPIFGAPVIIYVLLSHRKQQMFT